MNGPDITEESLFHAILALDVYHRGTNSGLKDLTGQGITKVGTATLQASSAKKLEEDIGFVAFQYELDDGTNVYGYRGTDRGFGNPTEIEHGFFTSLGIPDARQSLEAVRFFNEGQGGIGNADNAIVLGQSLGGGLAGFVSNLYGVQASIYNNMPFDLAVSNLHGLITGTKTVEQAVNQIVAQAYDIVDGLYVRQILYAALSLIPGAGGRVAGLLTEAFAREQAVEILTDVLENVPIDELKQQIYGDLCEEVPYR